MNKGDWTDGNDCHCPVCGETAYVRDAFEMSIDSEYECPKCGATLFVWDTELSRRWQFAEKK